METCEEEIVALLKKIEETKAMIESLSGRINNAQKQASEVEVYQRKIDDNIKYRQMKRDCTKLESDVDDLKEQIRAARVEVNVNEYRLLTEKADRLVEEVNLWERDFDKG